MLIAKALAPPPLRHRAVLMFPWFPGKARCFWLTGATSALTVRLSTKQMPLLLQYPGLQKQCELEQCVEPRHDGQPCKKHVPPVAAGQ